MQYADDLDELAGWIQLIHWPGLGRDSLRRLLAAFGSVQAVVRAAPPARTAVVGSRVALAPLPHAAHEDHLAAACAWLAGGARRRLMTLGDPDYPELLLQTADPPLWLFLEGRVELLGTPCLSLVGSRQATPQGALNARAFARDLASQGWTIVSGLAAGIDGQAHEGALEVDGATIAVVGTGLDQVYPRAHQRLAARIVECGLMVSEYPLGTPPLAGNFPLRNRIIAGLSRGTLVVEAAPKSGSLITARLAVEAGREVFAVPGSIHSPQSRGCHLLLRQGAKLVEAAEDVIEELVASRPVATRAGHSGQAVDVAGDLMPDPCGLVADVGAVDRGDDRNVGPVLRAMGHDPATLDALMARCGWPAPELSAHLLELEMSGLVSRLPGGLYQRIRST